MHVHALYRSWPGVCVTWRRISLPLFPPPVSLWNVVGRLYRRLSSKTSRKTQTSLDQFYSSKWYGPSFLNILGLYMPSEHCMTSKCVLITLLDNLSKRIVADCICLFEVHISPWMISPWIILNKNIDIWRLMLNTQSCSFQSSISLLSIFHAQSFL